MKKISREEVFRNLIEESSKTTIKIGSNSRVIFRSGYQDIKKKLTDSYRFMREQYRYGVYEQEVINYIFSTPSYQIDYLHEDGEVGFEYSDRGSFRCVLAPSKKWKDVNDRIRLKGLSSVLGRGAVR